MLRRLLIVSGLLGGAWLLVGASPAGALIVGPCSGRATLVGDDLTTTVDASTTARVKIPREADVQYAGSIRGIAPGPPKRAYNGKVVLRVSPLAKLVFGGKNPTIASWSWGGETDKVSTAGTTSYDLDLPADLLGGVKARASGFHNDKKRCTGYVDVEIGGSAVNPVSGAAAAVTAVAAAGLGLAALGKPV